MRMHEMVCKPSRRLAAGLVAGSSLAVAAVWLAALPLWAAVTTTLGIAAGFAAWSLRARAALRLRLPGDGTLQVWRAGDWHDAVIDAASFVSPALIVLRLRVGARRVTQVLLADSADAESLRKLRVTLRWASRTPPDTTGRGAG
jgi:toxin CptA